MDIRDTLAAIRELNATPCETADEAGDDLATMEYLLTTCEPRMSAAAEQHLMAQHMRLRLGVI